MSSSQTGNGAVSYDRFARGIAMRKQVLGDAHVERSMARVRPFSEPVQRFVTEWCWGEVWTRETLPPKTRSLLNLVMLTALGRNHELAVHVRGAMTNGCTVAEVQEALLQTLVYCGAPAALESFRVAEEVLDGLGHLEG